MKLFKSIAAKLSNKVVILAAGCLAFAYLAAVLPSFIHIPILHPQNVYADSSGTGLSSAPVPGGVEASVLSQCADPTFHYIQEEWVSPQNDTVDTSTTIASTATTVSLQINSVIYNCGNGSPNCDPYGSNAGEYNITYLGPNSESLSIPYPHPLTYPGNCTGWAVNSSSAFAYGGPFAPPGSGNSVPVNIMSQGTIDYDGGAVWKCAITSPPQNTVNNQTDYGNCPVYNGYFSIFVNVSPPPPVTISGTVYAYNGDATNGLAGISVYTCSLAGIVTTNNQGVFSFTITAGTGFCVRPNSNSTGAVVLPSGAVQVITPNGIGPPPAPPPSCGGDSVTYEWQSAQPGNSPTGFCNYGVNDNGYNVADEIEATISCTVSTNPPQISPDDNDLINATVNYTWSPSQWGFGNPAITSATGTITGAVTKSTSLALVWATPPSIVYYQGTIQAPGPNDTGKYDVSADIVGNSPYANSTKCKTANGLTVEFFPYVRAIGGDVMAGVSSQSVSAYYDNPNADIRAWNKGQSSNGELGAGATGSVLATSNIDQFASGQNVLDLLGPSPLAMSNDTATSPTYGGYFETGGVSGSDYYTMVNGASTCPATINDASIGTYGSYNAGTNTLTLSPDAHFLCRSASPVDVAMNIVYANSYPSVSSFPTFEVVVNKADINIDTNVGQLAGTYIDEGNKGTSQGTIIDTSSDKLDICPGTVDDINNSCSHDRLVIDGSFIANSIHFNRTYGTIDAATATSTTGSDPYDAEEFDYSPINWLATTPSKNSAPPVQAITSLPPVL